MSGRAFRCHLWLFQVLRPGAATAGDGNALLTAAGIDDTPIDWMNTITSPMGKSTHAQAPPAPAPSAPMSFPSARDPPGVSPPAEETIATGTDYTPAPPAATTPTKETNASTDEMPAVPKVSSNICWFQPVPSLSVVQCL